MKNRFDSKAAMHSVRAAVLVVVVILLPPIAQAGVKHWQGNVSGNWNTAGNWLENAVPVNGDELNFSAATRYTITNNISGLRVDRITFTDGGYVVRGNSVTLTNGILSAPAAPATGNDLQIDLTLGASQTFRCDRTNIYFTGEIALGANTLTVTNPAGTVVIIGAWAGAGLISGTGGITKDGAGTLDFAGWSIANTYTGPTYVKNGTFLLGRTTVPSISGPGTLTIGDGTGSAGSAVVRYYANNDQIGTMPIVINADGVLDLAGLSDTLGGSITFNGGDVTLGAGTLTLGADITVSNSSSVINGPSGAVSLPATRTFEVKDGVLFDLQAPVTGVGGLMKRGWGQMRLGYPGTYGGLTAVAQGELQVWTTGSLGASTSGTVVSNGASLLVNAGGTIADEALTLNGAGFEGSAALHTGTSTATTTWTGPVTLNLDTTIAPVQAAAVLDLSGVVTGNGGLTKGGSGKLVLSGATDNGYLGNTFVNSGTLELHKSGSARAIRYGTLKVGDGIGGEHADIVRVDGGGSDQISDSVPIIIASSGLLDSDALSETVGAMTLNGGDIALTVTVLTLSGNVTVLGASSVTSSLNGGVSLPATRTFDVTNGVAFDLAVPVAGSGGITKTGTGAMRLGGNNHYSGLTVVQQGRLELAAADALGGGGQGTVVSNGASLVFVSNVSIANEALTLNGPGFTGYAALDTGVNPGTNIWGGPVGLFGDCTFAAHWPQTMIRLDGLVYGTGGIRLFGSGFLYLGGDEANIYDGNTTVDSGTLLLGNSTSEGAVPGNLFIYGTVLLNRSEQINSNATVTLHPSGLLDLGGFSEALGGLSGSGQVKIPSGCRLYAGCNHSSGTYGGVISGSGEFHKSGNGTITLAANNTLTGRTYVDSGTLLVNGSQAQNPVTVESNGTLCGAGTVGHLTLNGNLAPGISPGLLTSSNLTFSSTGDYYVELNGTTIGSGYDQIKVRGTPFLANAALHVTLGFTSVAGNSFVIIDNDGSEPPNGEFAGIPDGAILNLGGRLLRMSYHSGNGNNDVVLTHVPPPQLQIARAGATNVTLFWPTNFTSFALEANTNLSRSIWSAISNVPVRVGTNFVVTNTFSTKQKSFRLRSP